MPMPTNERDRSRSLPLLKSAREARGLSTRQLSRKAGIARQTLIDLEHQRHGAYRSTIWKLADALNCHPADLLGPWQMTEKERKLLDHVRSGGRPYAIFVEDDKEDHTDE